MFKFKPSHLLGFALTAFFLGLILTRIQFDKVGEAFANANYLYLIPATAITMVAYLVRALRWQVILKPTKSISFGRSYSIMMIGFMANNLLPARIGEFVRAYTLGAKENISKTLSLATIILERVCDGLTLIGLMGLGLIFFPSPKQSDQVSFVEIFSTTLFAGATLFLIFLLFQERLAIKLVSFFMKPLPRRLEHVAHQLLMSFVLGLHALKHRRSILLIFLNSLIVWGLEGTSYYLMLQAFGIQDKLTPVQLIGAAVFLLVFVNLGIMIPSAPGYIGVYQAAAVLALGAYGVNESTSFSLALLTNTMQYVTVTIIGLFFFSRLKLNFNIIKDAKQKDKTNGNISEETPEAIPVAIAKS